MNRVLTSFTRSEKSIIAFVLALVGVGYGILDYQERQREVTVFQVQNEAPGDDAPAIELPKGVESTGLIDVNSADKAVLETLPGVGPSMADKIIQHRTANGPMRSMNDLDAISGVGPAMMTKLAPVITFGSTGAAPLAAFNPSTVQHPPALPAPVPLPPAMAGIPVTALAPPQNAYPLANMPVQQLAQVPNAENAPVNINTAGPEELDKLNGIGPALALRIIQDRHRLGPYRSAQDLTRVKGIGASILRKNPGRIVIH